MVRVNKNVLKTLLADEDLYAGKAPSSEAMDVDTQPIGELHTFKHTPLLQVQEELRAGREMDAESVAMQDDRERGTTGSGPTGAGSVDGYGPH